MERRTLNAAVCSLGVAHRSPTAETRVGLHIAHFLIAVPFGPTPRIIDLKALVPKYVVAFLDVCFPLFVGCNLVVLCQMFLCVGRHIVPHISGTRLVGRTVERREHIARFDRRAFFLCKFFGRSDIHIASSITVHIRSGVLQVVNHLRVVVIACRHHNFQGLVVHFHKAVALWSHEQRSQDFLHFLITLRNVLKVRAVSRRTVGSGTRIVFTARTR